MSPDYINQTYNNPEPAESSKWDILAEDNEGSSQEEDRAQFENMNQAELLAEWDAKINQMESLLAEMKEIKSGLASQMEGARAKFESQGARAKFESQGARAKFAASGDISASMTGEETTGIETTGNESIPAPEEPFVSTGNESIPAPEEPDEPMPTPIPEVPDEPMPTPEEPDEPIEDETMTMDTGTGEETTGIETTGNESIPAPEEPFVSTGNESIPAPEVPDEPTRDETMTMDTGTGEETTGIETTGDESASNVFPYPTLTNTPPSPEVIAEIAAEEQANNQ